MSGKKRAIHKAAASLKRSAKVKQAELRKWYVQEQRLVRHIAVFKENKTMQPQAWADGQVRYYEQLLATHRQHKPRG